MRAADLLDDKGQRKPVSYLSYLSYYFFYFFIFYILIYISVIILRYHHQIKSSIEEEGEGGYSCLFIYSLNFFVYFNSCFSVDAGRGEGRRMRGGEEGREERGEGKSDYA